MSNSNSGGGISLFGVLGVVFVVLKLVGVINWSWWWVLSPFWGAALITIIAIIFLQVISE